MPAQDIEVTLFGADWDRGGRWILLRTSPSLARKWPKEHFSGAPTVADLRRGFRGGRIHRLIRSHGFKGQDADGRQEGGRQEEGQGPEGNNIIDELADGSQPDDDAEAHQHDDSGVEISSELEEDDGEAMMSDCTQLEDDAGGAQGSSSSG